MHNLRPSATATKIARFMILMDSVPRLAPLLPADSARTVEVILRESGVVPSRSIQMMRRPSAAWLYRTAEAFLGRGQLLWFGLRKRWFAELVEESIASGARQLLVLGSGFDPLALITARKHPAVLCVEIDASPTAGPKRYGIDRAGLAVPNHFVSASDLSLTPLEEVLSSTPWSAEVPSVVIAEGLLMYLRREHVIDLLGKIRRSCGRGSRFAFTALDVDDAGRPRLVFSGKLLGRVIRAAVRSVGEDMHWGTAPRTASFSRRCRLQGARSTRSSWFAKAPSCSDRAARRADRTLRAPLPCGVVDHSSPNPSSFKPDFIGARRWPGCSSRRRRCSSRAGRGPTSP